MTEQLPPHRASPLSRVQTLLARAIALIAGAALLVGAFFVSVAFFAVAFAVGLCALAVFLWKTRHLRRQIRERMRDQGPDPRSWPPPAGDVIEGTVIRSSEDTPRRD
ncbi:MAG: hypothetical protein ABW278_10320 [Steroidobacteraceae bacterium]